MLRENYRIHGELSSTTVDNIIEAATSSKGRGAEKGYTSDDSNKSEDYHPRIKRNYSVGSLGGLSSNNESVSLLFIYTTDHP